MFTGIIEEVGEIKKIIRTGKAIELTVLCNKILNDVKNGDSIAVNGVCLTITNISNNSFTFDVMPETMNVSSIGKLKLMDKVNLERAVKASDRLGGHIVSGHIDGIGNIIKMSKDENAIWLTIEAPENVLKYIIYKGSVAIEGVSLTVAYVDKKCFKVSLIPLTMDMTNISYKKCLDIVNIECDIIGKYVEKLMFYNENKKEKESKISVDFLKENGYF